MNDRVERDVTERRPYDRRVLVDVLVYHWPTNTSGCSCGWAVLGASFPEHVADVYEQSVAARAALSDTEAPKEGGGEWQS